jgi:hypothetical protein
MDDGKYKDLCVLLSPCSEHERYLQKQNNYPTSTRFRFPSRYHGRAHKKDLVGEIQSLARNSGFYLPVTKSTHRKIGTSSRLVSVSLKCRCVPLKSGRKSRSDGICTSTEEGGKEQIFEGKKSSNQDRHKFKSATKPPVDPKPACPFSLVIFLSHDDHWYLSTRSTPAVHKHHPQLDPEQVPTIAKRRDPLQKSGKSNGTELTSHHAATIVDLSNDNQELQLGEENEINDDASLTRSEFMKIAEEIWSLVESYPDLQRKVLDAFKKIHADLISEIEASRQNKRPVSSCEQGDLPFEATVNDKKRKK